ncbi:MAG: DNA repair protein RecO, partial [Chloroflexi bacterium]
MLTSSKALVVHTVKYSNTSLVARLLTREHGLLPFIVKGIRSAKSQSMATLLQPMALLQVVFTFRENKNLLT